MQKSYRSAIVGCGSIAQVHAAALNKLSAVRLVACADILPARARALADQSGARAYDSLEGMLDHEDIDVLHICTPHALHTPMIREAVSRGLAVFCEKPPAVTCAQWEALRALPKNARVGVCFQNRYNPETRALKAMLESGEYGKILGARAFVTWKRDEGYYQSGAWRGTRREAGGGALANQSIHTLDLMVDLLGAPTANATRMENRHLKGVVEVEDTVESRILFGDAVALFYASTAYAGNAPVMLEILCERAALRMEPGTLEIIPNAGPRERRDYARSEPLGRDYWGNGHMPCIADFYARMDAGLPPAVGLPDIDATMRLMLDMYAQNGDKAEA